jgi:ubiquinone/menaquinone biosynthesis C-methylase UbiE/NAD-dependent dihydropyrimidine dehydrogenase PreA subunit
VFSYIFMKILESRPSRYDWGINLLTGGHARRVKREIVEEWVRPGIEMLDMGCGTGELLEGAAHKGANVTGMDISEGMLSIARQRFRAAEYRGKHALIHAGVAELNSLFAEDTFDLITATLVFSELHHEERSWVLDQLRRILRPSGTLVIADEVQPRTYLKRLFYLLARFPLAIVTYLWAQIGTKAVPDMAVEVSQAGFVVSNERRSLLDSFAVVTATEPERTDPLRAGMMPPKGPQEDVSFLKTVWDYVGRWFPNPVELGLRKIGSPGPQSPVFVTSNFHLTVRRVEKALSGADAWLLVAPTNGINVWCAASGGDMTAHSIAAVLKTGRIAERVTHRKLILPQLSAPGVDVELLKAQTGWSAEFGPVYATDIPAFLQQDHRKIAEQRLSQFPLRFRLEMLFSMNALVWLIVFGFLTLIRPRWAILASGLFWGTGLVLYAAFPLLPGRSGWLKAGLLCLVELLTIACLSVIVLERPWWGSWGWMLTALGFALWLGFDLKGIVGGNVSEAESLMHKLGVKSFGTFYTANPAKRGSIQHDRGACTNCLRCMAVCPKAVFASSDSDHHVRLAAPEECLVCQACVKQCPSQALSMT